MELLKKSPRFSFELDGKNAFDTPYTKTQTQNGNKLVTEYLFECGLKVTNVAKKYENHGVYEWVNYFENMSDTDTPLITNLWDCNVSLPCNRQYARKICPILPKSEEQIRIFNPRGCSDDEHDFEMFVNDTPGVYGDLLFAEKTIGYKNEGGRSSFVRAPFFNINQQSFESGYIYALGWSGQWNAKFTCCGDTVTVQGKIEDTEFVLYPKEKIRTASTYIMPYKATFEKSQNLWRRFVRDELSNILKRVDNAPLSAAMWGGMPSENIIENTEKLCKNDIPFSHVWVDAGWYGKTNDPTPNEFEGQWGSHLGDWNISPKIHPNGFLDVAQCVKKNGKKFILWFEPERVRKQSDFDMDKSGLLEDPKSPKYYLVNLGDKGAFDYTLNMLSDYIGKLGIDCLRQDFNINPLGFWRNTDTENRRGITEIKYITGLYGLWDKLLEKFPDLIIDNCASGGRRIDVEMIKRSIPLWRSDAQTVANPRAVHAQLHNMNLSMWTPFSGTGCGREYDAYRIRSSYSYAFQFSFTFSMNESFGENAADVELLRRYLNEYVGVRDYFLGDMYNLTKPTRDETAWRVTQWSRPENRDGMIQIFKDKKSPYTNASFYLNDIDKDADYEITDLDGGRFTVSGKTLCDEGFSVEVKGLRVAKIFIYKKIDRL